MQTTGPVHNVDPPPISSLLLHNIPAPTPSQPTVGAQQLAHSPPPKMTLDAKSQQYDEETALLGTSTPVSTELSGYSLMAASCIGFSGMSFLVHLAEDRYNFPAVSSVFVRGVFHSLLSLLYIIVFLPFPTIFTSISKSQYRLLVLRGLAGALGLVALFTTLQKLPVGDAVTLFFCGPVMVMILSYLVLGEAITITDCIAAVISFAGIVLIARPDVGGATVSVNDRVVGVVCGLVGAFLASIAYVTIRSLGSNIHYMISVLSFGLSATVVSMFMGGMLTPEKFVQQKEGALLVALAALFAFSGQCCLTKGLQLCRAGPGILVRNLDVPIAYILGILFLGEAPTLLRLFGSSLVLSAAFLIGVGQILRTRNLDWGFTARDTSTS